MTRSSSMTRAFFGSSGHFWRRGGGRESQTCLESSVHATAPATRPCRSAAPAAAAGAARFIAATPHRDRHLAQRRIDLLRQRLLPKVHLHQHLKVWPAYSRWKLPACVLLGNYMFTHTPHPSPRGTCTS